MPDERDGGSGATEPDERDDLGEVGSSDGTCSPRGLDPRAEHALAALLSLDPGTAARVREDTPPRRRPRPQHGPRLDLGEDVPRPE